MDCQNFIIEVANEFLSFPECYEDISDLLDATIDDYVGHNDIKTNQKIVEEYAGGVYEAIRLYEFHLGNAGELHKGTKSKFYQQLAYVSLFVRFYPEINNIIKTKEELSDIEKADNSSNEDNFCWDDVNDDISDMLCETFQSYEIFGGNPCSTSL
jgi:hypothetical protein